MHLRVSATCRDVSGSSANSGPAYPPMNIISPTANSNSAETLTSDSNSAVTLTSISGISESISPPAKNTTPHSIFSSMNTIPQPTESIQVEPLTAHHFKHSLRLPKSPEEWDEANSLLSAVTPLVLQATRVEEKNTILCDGIYVIMSRRFGSRPLPRFKNQIQSKLKQHDRALKKVTRLKNEARQALRRAERQGESVSRIKSLAGKFLSLLRDHSRLKRESSRRLQRKEVSIAREECHRNFWRYAKNLLDESATSQITPEFSASDAYSFFSEVYKSTPHHFETPS